MLFPCILHDKEHCAEIVNYRLADGFNPVISKKFDKWRQKNHKLSSSLVMSLMHPICKQRIESHVARINMKETSRGLRVISVDTVYIDTLPDEDTDGVRKTLSSIKEKEPDQVVCVVMFDIEGIENFYPYCFGKYSNIADIWETGRYANTHQDEWIKRLNGEYVLEV